MYTMLLRATTLLFPLLSAFKAHDHVLQRRTGATNKPYHQPDQVLEASDGANLRHVGHGDSPKGLTRVMRTEELSPSNLGDGPPIGDAQEVVGGTPATQAMQDGVGNVGGDGTDHMSEQDFKKQIWGTAPWPPAGLDHRPAAGALPSSLWIECSCIVLMVVVIYGAAAVCFPIVNAKESGQRRSSTSGNLATPPKQKFGQHLNALVCAIIWKNLHRRAYIGHLMRIGIPVSMLLLMRSTRKMLEEYVQSVDKDMPMVGKLVCNGQDGTQGCADAILDFFFSLTILFLVMTYMLFFIYNTAAEYESGFRHLLHISGLSRRAYFFANAGVQGVTQVWLAMFLMAFVSGAFLQLRIVLWTSPILVFLLTTLLAISAVMIALVVTYVFYGNARYASMTAQICLILICVNAPSAPLQPWVPELGKQSWLALALPVIPSYRGLFELVAGCTKGRCLSSSDMMNAAGKGVGPWTMIVGSSTPYDFTPPEALVSFVGLVLLQVVILGALVTFLEARRHPALHSTGVHGQNASARETREGVVLQVEGLKHSYGWLPGVPIFAESQVLNDVGFELTRGSMLGLLGPNGAGKTTVIRCITGEEAPNEGRVAVACADGSGAYVGLCPQETVVNNDLTVAENLLFFALLRGSNHAAGSANVELLLEATLLETKRDSLPDTLSGGMRRRLAVGCAMIASPSVVILDEPTTGLDPMSRRGIWSTIGNIKAAGGCCLITTHMLEEAEALCTDIVVLKKGVVAARGSCQQLKKEWGTGYTVNIDAQPEEMEKAIAFMADQLQERDRKPVKSTVQGQITYKVTQDEESLGHLIIAIARGKEEAGIKNWGVSQASLEDAYLRIVQSEAGEETT